MGNLPGGWELILILLVVVVVFGAKRLPDSARAVGRSMRILKAEAKGMKDDDGKDAAPTTTTAQVEAFPAVTPTAVPTVRPTATPSPTVTPAPGPTVAPVSPSTPVQAEAHRQSRQP